MKSIQCSGNAFQVAHLLRLSYQSVYWRVYNCNLKLLLFHRRHRHYDRRHIYVYVGTRSSLNVFQRKSFCENVVFILRVLSSFFVDRTSNRLDNTD